MNFADLRFWECLLAALLVAAGFRSAFRDAAAVRDGRFDRWFLLILGLVLLGLVSWLTFVIHLGVAVFTFACVAWGSRRPAAHGRWILAAVVPLQLLPLLYYKYADFLWRDVWGGAGSWTGTVAIPAGISFYTFQLVGFAVDTLIRREPLPRWFDFLNFAGFFPQIVAGPIERREALLPQIEGFRLRWSAADIDAGFRWMALGLFFKCALADNLAGQFHRGPSTNAYQIWLANGIFGLRIYYDFAGYSLIAVGIARCLGIRLSLNFLSPYCATGPAEFWRRWHVTLSHWFRDYIYVPLGGGRGRGWAFNVAVVFLVSGIWHGAGWNFVLWGGLHALWLIAARLTARVSVPAPLGWLGTVIIAAFSWLFFYETNPSVLWAKLATLAHPAAYGPAALAALKASFTAADLVTLGGTLGLCALTLLAEWRSLSRGGEPYSLLVRPWVLVVLVVLTVWLAPGDQNDFIYFAF